MTLEFTVPGSSTESCDPYLSLTVLSLRGTTRLHHLLRSQRLSTMYLNLKYSTYSSRHAFVASAILWRERVQTPGGMVVTWLHWREAWTRRVHYSRSVYVFLLKAIIGFEPKSRICLPRSRHEPFLTEKISLIWNLTTNSWSCKISLGNITSVSNIHISLCCLWLAVFIRLSLSATHNLLPCPLSMFVHPSNWSTTPRM